MTYLSIIEKFKILFNTLLDFKFILVFTIFLLLFTLLYFIKKLNSKKYILCMSLSFLIIFGISIIGNYKVLSNTFDDFATIFFGNIYFPSIYVYIGVLVISLISFIVSMLNITLKKVYKVINSIMFVLNSVLFIIVINIIAKNKIDIFSINSLYTDTTLVVMLELSMGLFILWLLSIITAYVTNCVCERITSNKTCNDEIGEDILFNPVLEVSNDLEEDSSVNVDADTVLVETVSNNQDIVDNNLALENVLVETTSSINIEEESTNDFENIYQENNLFDSILNGTIPVIYYDNSVKVEEHNLINPQMIYEDKYNKVKNDIAMFNNVEVSLENNIEKESNKFNENQALLETNDKEESIIFSDVDNVKENNIENKLQLSVEERSLEERTRVSEERLIINTVSLNDLIDEENNVNNLELKNSKMEFVDDKLDIEDNKHENYTIDDYKKIVKMLKEIKMHSDNTNINIDDAVAISLISNYSIDDCMKFKNILKSNLS